MCTSVKAAKLGGASKSRSVEVKDEPEHVKVLSTELDMDMDKLEEETTQGILKWSTEGGKAI